MLELELSIPRTTAAVVGWDESIFVTCSNDQTINLYDSRSYRRLKTFESDKQIFSAIISPLSNCPFVIGAGGQDAASVTTTSAKEGKFEYTFFHTIFEEQVGTLKGHFGPVNALAWSPDGRSYASGGEEGFVRINHFDNDFFTAHERALTQASGL